MNQEAAIPCLKLHHQKQCLLCELLQRLAPKKAKVLLQAGVYSQNWVTICVTYVFSYCHKKMEPVITVAITAQWTTTITSCNGSSYVNMQFSQDQDLLFWQSTPPLRWHQTSSPNRTRFESLAPAHTPWRYQFTKFSSCRKCTWHIHHTYIIQIFQWVIHCE